LFVAIKLTDMVKSQHNIRKVLKWESWSSRPLG
jgi:hypothetical protein